MAYKDLPENYYVQRLIFGKDFRGYRQHADDIKKRMEDIRSNESLNNRERLDLLTEVKTEMNALFGEAGKDLSVQDFRRLRSFVNQ